jgi:hypothetical protein
MGDRRQELETAHPPETMVFRWLGFILVNLTVLAAVLWASWRFLPRDAAAVVGAGGIWTAGLAGLIFWVFEVGLGDWLDAGRREDVKSAMQPVVCWMFPVCTGVSGVWIGLSARHHFLVVLAFLTCYVAFRCLIRTDPLLPDIRWLLTVAAGLLVSSLGGIFLRASLGLS